MGKISVVVEDKSKTKDKVFGYLPLCDEVYRNRRLEQAKRVSQLYSMAEEAKEISKKYLCLLKTDNESLVADSLDDELMVLVEKKHMPYSRANNIVDIAGVMLNALSDELNYKAKVR